MDKICSVCKIEKDDSEFYQRSDTGKLRSWCKECHSIKASERYKDEEVKARHREVSRNHLLRKYGLSEETFTEMYNLQKGLCKICDTPVKMVGSRKELSQIACVDHCHKTGKVRAILCRTCNAGIGHLRDDPVLVEKALLYLKDHG